MENPFTAGGTIDSIQRPKMSDFSSITRTCAIRIIYAFSGSDRTWERARQLVDSMGVETALKNAESKHDAVTKARRKQAFLMEYTDD